MIVKKKEDPAAKKADEYATELMKKHPSVKRSAFPKAPNAWHSVILNDEFSDEEVKRILGFSYNSVPV